MMKITKTKLRQIVKEAVLKETTVVNEFFGPKIDPQIKQQAQAMFKGGGPFDGQGMVSVKQVAQYLTALAAGGDEKIVAAIKKDMTGKAAWVMKSIDRAIERKKPHGLPKEMIGAHVAMRKSVGPGLMQGSGGKTAN